MISLFGGRGFILGNFSKIYSDISYVEDRESNNPKYNKVLYGISTTHNYHVFDNIYKDVDTNLTKLLRVLENCKGRELEINFLSSWFIYANSKDDKCSESSLGRPLGFYSATKQCAEQLLESYCTTFNIPYRIMRLCNVIGGDSSASNKKNALEFLISKLKNNETIDIYEGDNYRNYLHAKDVCRAIMLLIFKGRQNEIYNVGSDCSHRLIDILNYCKRKLNSTSDFKIIPQPEFHKQVQVVNFHMDTTKLKNLGFVPEYSIWGILDELCVK